MQRARDLGERPAQNSAQTFPAPNGHLGECFPGSASGAHTAASDHPEREQHPRSTGFTGI